MEAPSTLPVLPETTKRPSPHTTAHPTEQQPQTTKKIFTKDIPNIAMGPDSERVIDEGSAKGSDVQSPIAISEFDKLFTNMPPPVQNEKVITSGAVSYELITSANFSTPPASDLLPTYSPRKVRLCWNKDLKYSYTKKYRKHSIELRT